MRINNSIELKIEDEIVRILGLPREEQFEELIKREIITVREATIIAKDYQGMPSLDNCIIALLESLITPREACLIPHVPLFAILSDYGLCALWEKLLTYHEACEINTYPDPKSLEYLLSSNGLFALREKLINIPQVLKMHNGKYLLHLLSDNGILALREKFITPSQAFSMPSAHHLCILLSNNGFNALRERLISPDQATRMCFDHISALLSDKGLIFLREGVISAEDIVALPNSFNLELIIEKKIAELSQGKFSKDKIVDLNGTQKNILEGTFSFIVDSVSELGPLTAIKALKAIMDSQLSEEDKRFFEEKGVLECVAQGRQILLHPCPENRSESYPYAGREEGFSIFKLEKARIKFQYLDGSLKLNNGRVIPKNCIIRNSARDAFILAKEATGLLSLTAREDDDTPFVTKRMVSNYVNELIQKTILKNEEIAAKKIQSFCRNPQLLTFGFIGFRKKFNDLVADVSAALKIGGLSLYRDEIQKRIHQLKSFPKYAIYHCIAKFPVTDENYEAFHYLFLRSIKLDNENIIHAFLGNKNINPQYSERSGPDGADQTTALLDAACLGFKDTVKRLLKLGVDCHTYYMEITPFIWAIKKGHTDVVKVFLEERNFYDLIQNKHDEDSLNKALSDFCKDFHLYFSYSPSPIELKQKVDEISRLLASACEKSTRTMGL